VTLLPPLTNSLNAKQFTNFSPEELKSQMQRFDKRFSSTVTRGVSDAGKAYLAALNRPQKQINKLDYILQGVRNAESRPQKVLKQMMDFEEAKSVLREIMRVKLVRENRKFIGTDAEVAIIMNLLKYFIGDPSCPYNLHKGIFLYGNTGVGKTFTMECFKTFCSHTATRKPFRQKKTPHICKEISKGVAAKKSPYSIIDKYIKGDLFLDDLGDELSVIKVFGQDIPYMDIILNDREEAYTKGSQMTYITSNLIPMEIKLEDGNVIADEVEVRYGERIRSRLEKQFNMIYWGGADKRRI
jgi:hypothetical protein